MDGTFGGGDLISASLAIMLGGGTDAELHDKEVTLTTSDVTGSQTAIFEYDPQNEPVSGDPAGPWDGYSLFTIDLSGVKDDIEDLQQQVSNLEDELEACHDCRDEVVAAIQEYDPEYNPAEGECPAPKVGEIADHAKDCDDCKAEVVAKLQEYDPNFDPQTCEDIVDEIDDVYQKGKDDEKEEDPPGYDFDPDVPLEDITKITGADPIGSPNTDNQIKVFCEAKDDNQNVYTGTRIDATAATGNLYAYIRAQVVDNYGNILYNARYPNYDWWVGYNDGGYIKLNSYYIYNTDRLHVDYQTYSTARTADFQSSYFADFQPPYKVRNS